MHKPKLTIGMPHCEDFDGVWFSIQSLCLHHAEVMQDVEIIVVNDGPDSASTRAVRAFVENFGNKCHSMKFINHEQPLGPALAKNDVFLNAKADHVLCMDCHILFPPGVIKRLIEFFEKNPQSNDLYCGPNVLDDLQTTQTEMIPIWRGQAWGIWHYNPAGDDPDGEPYEIWGNGCGLMACRKFAWVGFNPHFRGFGAEEGYIHEKFRKFGRRAMNLPFLKWIHRYERPTGPGFFLSRETKMRNYVLGFIELGMDLQPIYDHFVSLGHPGEELNQHLVREHSVDPQLLAGLSYDQLQDVHRAFKISEENWRYLIDDPINHYTPQAITTQEKGHHVAFESRENWLARALATEDDINKHLPALIAAAEKCDVIEEITRRSHTTVAMVSARPKKMRTRMFGTDLDDRFTRQLMHIVPPEVDFNLEVSPEYNPNWEIDECDLFFFKCPHNYHDLQVDLPRWSKNVRRYIAIHDTSVHGEAWENDVGPGLYAGMKDLVATGKWFVVYHNPVQYGLTVLGCQEQDRPEKKIHAWPPEEGPGTELKAINDTIGIEEKPNCMCKGIRIEMDVLGVEGCIEHRERLVKMIQENSVNWNWSEKVQAAAKLATGPEWKLAWKLDLSDPYGSLFDIAVQRYKEKQDAKV